MGEQLQVLSGIIQRLVESPYARWDCRKLGGISQCIAQSACPERNYPNESDQLPVERNSGVGAKLDST